jgi:hypothetical protein
VRDMLRWSLVMDDEKPESVSISQCRREESLAWLRPRKNEKHRRLTMFLLLSPYHRLAIVQCHGLMIEVRYQSRGGDRIER